MERFFLELDGKRVSYLKGGKGETLLFLHGLWVDSSGYIDLLKELSKEFTVYALDLPGFGKSFIPDNIYSYEDYAEVIHKFLRKLTIKKTYLLGHSMGGGMAVVFSSLYPRYVKKLILINSIGMQEKLPIFTLYGAMALRSLTTLFSPGKLIKYDHFFKSFFLNLFRSPLYIFKATHVHKDDNLEKYATKITSNTLLLWSDHDEFFPLIQGRKLHRLIPKSKLHIIKGTHDWCIFNPRELRRII